LSAVAAVAAVLVGGCATYNINLKKAPSDNFLSSVQSDDSKRVSYTFETELPEKVKYKNIVVELNPAYESNLKHYMNAKYSVDSDGDYKVEIILKSCSLSVAYAGKQVARTQTSATATTGHSATYQGTVEEHFNTISTEIIVKARVHVGGRVTEKEFTAFSENTGNSYDASVVQVGINMAIDKSLQAIDKFLDKTLSSPVGGHVNDIQ
jgi:hypothetical protein